MENKRPSLKNKVNYALKMIFCFFLKHQRCKNYILFESVPDFSDNTEIIYQELIKRGFDKKYKFYWIVHDGSKLSERNTIRLNYTFKCFYFLNKAKFIICNNTFIYKKNKRQTSLYIGHGGPTKEVKDYYYVDGDISYILVQTPFFIDDESKSLRVPINKIYALGYPRVDKLIKSECNIKEKLHHQGKIIFWYPTFKNTSYGLSHGSGYLCDFLKNGNDIKQINDLCLKLNILLIVKLHWSSCYREYLKKSLSNIKFADEAFFENLNTSSYEALAKSDALITDYSSIFYDYLPADKPISFIFSDILEYSKNPGLVPSFLGVVNKCGKIIYKYDEFVEFLNDISNNKDDLKVSRNEIRKIIYPFDDECSTDRVVDFIVDKFGLKK